MLGALNNEVTEGLRVYERLDLLPRHRLTVMDDAAKYDGATSHDIRDHFHSWVTGELPTVLKDPGMWDDAVLGTDEEGAVPTRLGSRYNFCLFIDDICLESLDEMESPVVKLLCRFLGYREPGDREYQVHPEFEDGETEVDEEDVGWMYMSIVDYCSHYRDLVDTNDWYGMYLRPPYMMLMDELELPGTGEPKVETGPGGGGLISCQYPLTQAPGHVPGTKNTSVTHYFDGSVCREILTYLLCTHTTITLLSPGRHPPYFRSHSPAG
ncbi:hypothetical protein BJX63DRAFT_378343 [Aspergillus granulosus]|uniref:Uncharacterized protein n=1 Tax=Aspergillus granulosus TaxID=176169 RepID=A0ABR4I170_9EURO